MEDNNNKLNQNIHRPATLAIETNSIKDTEFNICSLNIQGLKNMKMIKHSYNFANNMI